MRETNFFGRFPNLRLHGSFRSSYLSVKYITRLVVEMNQNLRKPECIIGWQRKINFRIKMVILLLKRLKISAIYVDIKPHCKAPKAEDVTPERNMTFPTSITWWQVTCLPATRYQRSKTLLIHDFFVPTFFSYC